MDKKYLQSAKTIYSSDINNESSVKNIYYGEVISNNDPFDGRRIKVRIHALDKDIPNENLVDCYPIAPLYFWSIPKIGEMVRIFIENTKLPQQGRHWIGSIISQPQKINKDEYYTALSTTNSALSRPQPPVSKNPKAKDVFPNIEDIAMVGRNNTDIILKDKQVFLRCGKHKINNVLEYNDKNPAIIEMSYDKEGERSSIITNADYIALLSHSGDKKYKNNNLSESDRDFIFENTHPMGRADYIVQAMEIMRRAIINHIHPYPTLKPDATDPINELSKIDFNRILSNNIRIN